MEKENPLESSGYFMRIHQSSPGCIPKRWERFTFSRGEGRDEGGLKTIIPASPCLASVFFKTL
jgi:hypothetical protein